MVVRRENKFDDFANFNFSILPPGANRENVGLPNIAGGVLVLDALLFAIAMSSMPGNLLARAGTSAILGVLLAAGGRCGCHAADIHRERSGQPDRAEPEVRGRGQGTLSRHTA